MAKLEFKTDSCKGCGLCVDACPKDLLEIAKEKINLKGHHPAQFKEGADASCVGCASCAIMCPDCIITVER